MSSETKQEREKIGDKVANTFIRLSHPISFPLFLYLILYGPYLEDGIFFIPFIAPLALMGIARALYFRWRLKPPIKLTEKNHQLAFTRALEPATMIAGLLIFGLVSKFVFRGLGGGVMLELILLPAIIAFIVRLVWNISLHHIAWGALTTLAYYSILSETYFWIPMLGLTLLLYLGWAMVQLKRHNIAQVVAGFAAGLLSMVAIQEIYVPYIQHSSLF